MNRSCILDIANIISAAANVSIAVCTWILVVTAIRGLSSWKQNIHISEVLEKKRAARRLNTAVLRLCRDIKKIRHQIVTDAEVTDGKATLQNGRYVPQQPDYYLKLIDRRNAEVWEVWEESLVFFESSTFEKLKMVLAVAKRYRDAYAEFHFSAIVLAPHLAPGSEAANSYTRLTGILNPSAGDASDRFGQELEKQLTEFTNSISHLLEPTAESAGQVQGPARSS
jgi:hypothetical protein